MGFELVKKGFQRDTLSPMGISISRTTMTFGSEIIEKNEGETHVEFYLDRENYKVGARFCKNSMTGFKLLNQRSTTSKTITTIIPEGVYECEIDDDGMVVFSVPEIAEK